MAKGEAHVKLELDTQRLSNMIRLVGAKADEICKTISKEIIWDIDHSWSGYYPPASTPGNPPAHRTATLRVSLKAVIENGNVRIEARTPYAKYLEYGTPLGQMKPRPFIRPAVERARGKFGQRFKVIFGRD